MKEPASEPLLRKTVSLPEGMWKRVEDFQFGNRIKRDSEAIRQLVEMGLAVVDKAAAKAEKSK